MLAATQRLRRSSEFAAVMRGGRRAGRGAVVVHLSVPQLAGPQLAGPQHGTTEDAEPARAGSIDSLARAGFVVSKAVGNAVVRNRVRRRLRHLVSERLAGLPAGAMLVVRAQPSAAGATAVGLAADLDAALAAASSPRRRRAPSSGAR